MRRLGAIEKTALVLGAVLMGFGIFQIIHPTEIVVPHASSGPYKNPLGSGPGLEYVSTRAARIYGFIALGLGAGIAGLAYYRPPHR